MFKSKAQSYMENDFVLMETNWVATGSCYDDHYTPAETQRPCPGSDSQFRTGALGLIGGGNNTPQGQPRPADTDFTGLSLY